MKPQIDPKVDYAFKRLFGSEDTKDILISVLNAFLRPAAGQEVVEVELKNPFDEKQFEADKLSSVDVKARDARGRWFVVEMQLAATPEYLGRAAFYWRRSTPANSPRATTSAN